VTATIPFHHHGLPFRLYHEGEQPPAAWLLTFCGHDLIWLPELPEETTTTLLARCEEWLRANFRLIVTSGARFQLYRQYQDFFRVEKDEVSLPINWIAVQEGLYQTSLPVRLIADPEDPVPALESWLRQHPLTCVGGPLAGRRLSDQGDSFRPLVPGKVNTKDGPLDGTVPAPGVYSRDGQEYLWRSDPAIPDAT
jgi:hypothetical protein